MEILKINQKNQNKILKVAADYIRDRKVVVFPTDTIYGMLCAATMKNSVDKIFKIKNRSRQKFFPVFVRDIKTAKDLSKISREKESLLKKSWPGKVTFVLERKSSRIYGIDRKTIALRIPNYKPLNLLLKKLDIPLIQTSANISGKKTPQSAKEIIRQFKNKKQKPDLIIDASKLPQSKPSTIIDLTVSPPKILRP
jgi:L-threonylcarbamoyladenylate synthase